jgi:pimeloyl-ACP methyl ester carboxylesterase
VIAASDCPVGARARRSRAGGEQLLPCASMARGTISTVTRSSCQPRSITLAWGVYFLTANFRGHHATAAYEDFDDVTPALDAWLDAHSEGLPRVLQGHRLGALKIVRYLGDDRAKHRDRVQKLILLAPFDAVALYANGKPEEAEDRLERVRKIAARDGGKRLVPSEMFDYRPISASTFLQIGGRGTVADQFPSREALDATTLSAMRHPTFVAVGSRGPRRIPLAVQRGHSGRCDSSGRSR